MQCLQSLGSHNWSGAHPFLQPSVPPFWGFRAAGFLAFWGGKRTRSWGIGTKALPEWYKHLIYNQCNMCKHLEVIIEVSLIPFYSVLYLRLGVSEQDLGCFGGKQFRSWCIGTKALPEWYKHLIYNQCNVYKHLEVIIEVSLILFYSLTYLRLCVSELLFWRSRVVNRLVCGVSVSRPFLNDTNIFLYPMQCV